MVNITLYIQSYSIDTLKRSLSLRHAIYGDVFKIQFFDRMIVITSNQDAIRVLVLS